MEMYFLLLYFVNGMSIAPVVMPQAYSKEQCEKLASGYSGMQGKCIPVPDAQYTTKAASQFSGYYCGQNPDKCDLSKVYCSEGKPKMYGTSIFCEK